MKGAGYTSSVPAVEQAVRVLLCLAKGPNPRVRLTDLSQALGIPKSKVYSLLNTLMKFGLVQRDQGTKTYSLGPGLLFLSRRYLDNLDLREVLDPCLSKLARSTKSTAIFGLIGGEYFFITAKQDGAFPFSVTLPLGRRFPLTAGAHGKAIVAFLPEEEREEILKGGELFFHGDPARLDRERLRAELEECRRRGFAEDLGELQPGVNALSAPVFGPSGKPVGAVVLVGTFPREKVGTYGPLVSEVAREISSALGSSSAMSGGKEGGNG